MIDSQVQVQLDQEQIKQYIKEQLDQQVKAELLFVDINKLSEITSLSKRYLEEEVLHDPRMKLAERRKNRKRLWVYSEARESLQQIAEEW